MQDWRKVPKCHNDKMRLAKAEFKKEGSLSLLKRENEGEDEREEKGRGRGRQRERRDVCI